MVIATAAFL